VVAHEVDAGNLAVLGLREEVGLCEAGDDVFSDRGERGRAVVRDELHAVVLGRVVGGGDHAGTSEPAVDDGVGDHGRRGVTLGEEYVEAVAGEHLGEALGEPLRGLAGVVADRDWLVVARPPRGGRRPPVPRSARGRR